MQGGGGGPDKTAQQEEERARQQEMKNAMLAQLLDQQARARCESSCFVRIKKVGCRADDIFDRKENFIKYTSLHGKML